MKKTWPQMNANNAQLEGGLTPTLMTGLGMPVL